MRVQTLTFVLLLLSFLSKAQWQITGGPNNPVVELLQTDQFMFAGCSSVSTYNGVYKTNNSGTSWTSCINSGVSYVISGLAFSNGNVFASQYNEVYVSTNYGANWSVINNGLPVGNINCLASHNGVVYAGGSGLVKTVNNGLNWTTITNTWTGTINSIFVNDDLMLVGTQSGKVYKSTNGGTTWTNISVGIPATQVFKVLSVGSNYFAGTSLGIYKSANAGISWQQTSSTAQYITDILFINNIGFAASAGSGVLMSPNEGQTWYALNDGLVSNQVVCLSSNSTYLFAGVSGSYLHRRLLSELINTDTCFVTEYDTTHVTLVDTTFFVEFDTLTTYVNDTTYYDVIDTSYVTMIDTSYFSVFDTSFVTINDTNFISINDTITVVVNDTLFFSITDTTFISVTDTLFIETIITSILPEIINIIKVYPNPTSSVINIHTGDYALMSEYRLQVENSIGQVVFSDNIVQQQFQISISSIGNAGLYFLRILDGNNSTIHLRKIVIQ